MAQRRKIVLGIVIGVVILIQFIPVDRSNPPVEQEIVVSDEVRAVLRESCYDCHSNETRWPWYSYVAPVSWLVAEDVEHAREHVNFSTWNRYDAEERADHLEEIWEEIEEGGMPLRKYVWLHNDARLTDDDENVLRTWVEATGVQADSGGTARNDEDAHEDSER
jgi:hypothetical protein